VRKDPVIFVCGYLLTAPTLLFGSASGTTISSSGTAATTLLNQLSTVFSGNNPAHQVQFVPKPIRRASPRPRPPPNTTPRAHGEG
jgi:hypothetical protein